MAKELKPFSVANIVKFLSSMVLYCCLFAFWVFPAAIHGQTVDRVEKIEGKPRNGQVKQVVIHATGGPDCNPRISFKSGTLGGIVNHFKNNQKKISIHYIIGRDGTIVQMVPEDQIAYHVRCCNRKSIGIELINNGDGKDPYPDKQIDSLKKLLKSILERHNLDSGSIKGHSELDDTELACNGKKIKRKVDPGSNFPWDKVRANLD